MIYVYVNMCIYIYISISIYLSLSLYIYIYMYIYTCIYIYIYIYMYVIHGSLGDGPFWISPGGFSFSPLEKTTEWMPRWFSRSEAFFTSVEKNISFPRLRIFPVPRWFSLRRRAARARRAHSSCIINTLIM